VLTSRNHACLAVVALAVAGGCDSSPVYDAGGRHVARGSVSDREQWRASGSVGQPGNAVDGNINTAAEAAAGTSLPALTVDLGRPCLLNLVAIDHGRRGRAFAGRVEVLTSMDGTNFTRRQQVHGTRRVTTLLIVTPVLAQYIRLRATAAGPDGWSLAEIHIQ